MLTTLGHSNDIGRVLLFTRVMRKAARYLRPASSHCAAHQYYTLICDLPSSSPETHIHVAVHHCRRCQVLIRFFAFADAVVELPKSPLAVRNERPHPARLCKRQCLAVVRLAHLWIEFVRMGRNVTEQV